VKKLKNEELNRLSVEEFGNSKKTPFVVVLDNVRSANNVGSVFRTSDAFLLEKIYLCGITVKPPHKDIHKTALGAEMSVAWEYFENTIDAVSKLKEEGYIIVSIEQIENSISLEKFDVESNKKYAFVFGNEVKGVNQKIVDISDSHVEIPQYGTKHSFNISVSCGIVLWELFRKMKF
jgi:tRNA G18 (ribose-2'-O)-methylase SpoU